MLTEEIRFTSHGKIKPIRVVESEPNMSAKEM
jgi:hypothetical protein